MCAVYYQVSTGNPRFIFIPFLMSRIIFLLCYACLAPLLVLSQEPQTVKPITQEQRPNEWYLTQANLWKKELDKNRQNKAAWYNYYLANRVAGQTGDRPTPLAEIVADMRKAIPNSYEYHYVAWWDSGNDSDQFFHLQKAYDLDSSRPELLHNFVTRYEMTGEWDNRKVFNQKWFESGEISPTLLTYNYNVLMSVERNAILFSNGDNDTYPIWVLQDVQGIRTDVLLLNRWLVRDKSYLDKVLKKVNLPPFSGDPASAAYVDELVQHLASQSGRPVYFCLTVAKSFRDTHKQNLYMTGLASRYSEKRMDNLALLRSNIEQRFLLDELTTCLFYEPEFSSNRFLKQAYLAPFLMLHQSYQEKGESQKAADIRTLSLKIAREVGQEEAVRKALDR